MARLLYEKQEDLDRESAVARVLEVAWNCSMAKLAIKYHLDYVAKRGDTAAAFCEIKSRSYSMEQIDRFGGYLLSINKWSSAESLYRASSLPFILVVCATDGIYYASFTTFKPDSVVVRGRKDRNDWQDIEPCVLLNTSRFTKLQKKADSF